MKKILLTIITIIAFNLTTKAQNVNIPDAIFKNYLITNTSINTNMDSEIQVSEANAYTGTIYIFNLNISDLTGIEEFINLTSLLCRFNSFSTLDLSQNTALTVLNCSNNSLNSIDLSQNTALTILTCSSIGINNLDLSQNINLTSLDCRINNLTTLDLSQNVNLTNLNCANNNLNSIDLSLNINLTDLNCFDNNLTNLNLSQNNVLSYINTSTNNLTSLDLSQNTALTYLGTAANSLTSLDLSQNTLLETLFFQNNNISSINVSQNTLLTFFRCDMNNLSYLNMKNLSTNTLATFNATQNSNLNCIEVDNVSLATTNWTNIDPASSFSLNCIILVNSIAVQGQGGASTISTNGGDLQMEATILPANADDATYTWSVTNGTGSASINNSGLLTAITNGDVTVTATANDGSGVTGTSVVSISNQTILVSSISVQGQAGASMITTNIGTLQMEATVLPINSTDNTYTWSVANGTGSALIDANGLLTALTDGDVTVSATANDGSGIVGASVITISNQIVLVSSITVQGEAGENTITTPSGTLQMEASVLPANADNTSYTWSVTNGTGSTSIDANGLLAAMTDGDVTVTATANDGSGVTGTKTITISNQSLGLNNKPSNDIFSIYPNPVESSFTIYGEDKIDAIKIMDIRGKTLRIINNSTNIIDVSDLTKGIYFLQLQIGNKIAIQKVIKK